MAQTFALSVTLQAETGHRLVEHVPQLVLQAKALGLTPTTSTTIMTVIGDALVVMLMEKIGFDAAEYSKRHHGGYLGAKSRSISGRG